MTDGFRYRKQPILGKNTRPVRRFVPGQLSAIAQELKTAYTQERRVLEHYRSGKPSSYEPSPTWEGKSTFDSPEARITNNKWADAHKNLKKLYPKLDPVYFVRLLFHLLRGSSTEIPTVVQLANPKFVKIIHEYLDDPEATIRQQFVSESQRAKSFILLHKKLYGYSTATAVYYALVDEALGLSPLFRYCLAMSSCEDLKATHQNDSIRKKLLKTAKRFELLAAMDYTLFPEQYESVFGPALPSKFKAVAGNIAADVAE